MSRLFAALLRLGIAAAVAAQEPPPIEPADLPPSIEQGVDMIYADAELARLAPKDDQLLNSKGFEQWTGAPLDMFTPMHPLYTELRRGLVRYGMRWGELPQFEIPAGPPLKPGQQSERVSMLRERLGLFPLGAYDAELAAVVRDYQLAHGLPADGVAGPATVTSLNRGFEHYERLLLVNLERARRLPDLREQRRYIIVDVGGARLWMYENGQPVDNMKVIVGSQETATPMMAGMLRHVALNPYWNVPPDFARDVMAKRILAQGVSYLNEREYEVLENWTEDAAVLDPATVDWRAFAEGKSDLRLRRKPGPANSMGEMKFMLPNDYGIYLHDTPDKSLFAKDDRWISNGCIRVEDARRLAAWLFGGERPRPSSSTAEERVELPRPVPVYMTYLTAWPGADGIAFRADPYKRDQAVLARYFGEQPSFASARP